LRDWFKKGSDPLSETAVYHPDRLSTWIIQHSIILPWPGLGTVGVSEAFALRLRELTGCLIADRRNGRLVEPEALVRKKRAAVGELSQVNPRI
jgi:hypothetical protein